MNDPLLSFLFSSLYGITLAEALLQACLNRDISYPEFTISSLMIWPRLFGSFHAKEIEMLSH